MVFFFLHTIRATRFSLTLKLPPRGFQDSPLFYKPPNRVEHRSQFLLLSLSKAKIYTLYTHLLTESAREGITYFPHGHPFNAFVSRSLQQRTSSGTVECDAVVHVVVE